MANSESKQDAPPAESKPAAEVAVDGKKRKTKIAELRALDHRGETINTRWGPVTFDANGLSELEVPEDEVQMLRDIKPFSWLASDHPSYKPDEKPAKISKPVKG